MTKYLPLERIRRELFGNADISQKICQLYQIEPTISGEALEHRLFTLLGQKEANPGVADWQQNVLFEQASRAIASN